MSVVIKEVKSKRDLRRFVQFGIDLYKGNPYYCPPIFSDEMDSFNPKKNPAFDFSEAVVYLAYRDGKIVGRIAGIINHRANEAWKVNKCRFGWFDFIDDHEVFTALLDAVAAWGKSKGMDKLNGPVGFTDMDKEGLLIEGYERNAPMCSLYTHPYYVAHYEQYGLEKEADWIEYQIIAPKSAPERMRRVADIVAARSKVHVVKFKSFRELKKRYGYSFFDVFDEAYMHLYNYSPLTERQKKYYTNIYIPLLNFDFVTAIANEDDELVGVGVGMPSLSDALRKCGGHLFPIGWIYALKALKAKKMTDFDLLLIGIRPKYQDKGLNAMIFSEMGYHFADYEIQRVETTSILETNKKNQANFADLEHIQHKRRRAYIKDI